MDYRQLDALLNDLEARLPNDRGDWPLFSKSEWAPIWDACKVIQDGFKETRYPTRDEQQRSWERFVWLRNEASRLKRLEGDRRSSQSAICRDEILELVRRARWSRTLDTIFFFDPTSRDEMKQLGALLSRARHQLSECKLRMLGEHKKECFDAIVEAQETHDEYWSRYKAELSRRQQEFDERKATHEARQVEWQQRTRERKSRIQHNINKNREQLSKAVDALYRQRERANELREKVRESTSPKWASIHMEWLTECEAKLEDIEASVRRITSWIEEGEDQLRNY